jgi:pimeloyl-ACP methyl ester carboxylesterase
MHDGECPLLTPDPNRDNFVPVKAGVVVIRVSRRRAFQMAAAAPLCLTSRSLAAEAINETGFVRIGGIDQWIAVQGHDRRNPVILYLHGGPGEAQSPFLKKFLPWQRDFIVVNWDQRGAGKTFGRNGRATPNMTVDRLVEDIAEIVQLVSARFAQHKVILVGQSWGSLLGVYAIKRHPDLFHAYLGTAQVVSIPATIADLARYARQKATETGDKATLDALDAAVSLPEPASLGAMRKASSKWAASVSDLPYTKTIDEFRGHAPYPAGDVADWVNGGNFSGNTIGPTMISMDLRILGLDMPVPFFIAQGRDDHITGFEPARHYAEDIRAPKKAFVPLDGGHYACFTNPNAFVGALNKYARPLAT